MTDDETPLRRRIDGFGAAHEPLGPTGDRASTRAVLRRAVPLTCG